jgi:hypothetical protein
METTEREIEIVRERASGMSSVAKSIVVDSEGTLLAAGETLRAIKDTAKLVKGRKEEITRPMNEALKSARALFAPIERMCEDAETLVSHKMARWQNEQEEILRKAEEAAARKIQDAQEKLDEGKITERAAKKIENKALDRLAEMPEAVRSSSDFHTREIKKFRITDEAAIPREFLMLDEKKVRNAMMGGINVAGIYYYKEKTYV